MLYICPKCRRELDKHQTCPWCARVAAPIEDQSDKMTRLEAEVERLNANLTAHREKYDRIKEQLRQKQRVEDAARALLPLAKIAFYAANHDELDHTLTAARNLEAALAGKEG